VEKGVDPLLISLANVGTAIGTMAGSLVSAKLCNQVPVGKGVVVTLALMSVAYIPMALSDEYGFVVLSTLLASLPMPLFSALVNGFVFSKTPVAKQGRTRAAIMTSIMFIVSLSGAFAGELLPRTGFRGFVIVMMAFALLGAMLAAFNPRIRTIPASPKWDEVEL
jgi:MFS family permease